MSVKEIISLAVGAPYCIRPPPKTQTAAIDSRQDFQPQYEVPFHGGGSAINYLEFLEISE